MLSLTIKRCNSNNFQDFIFPKARPRHGDRSCSLVLAVQIPPDDDERLCAAEIWLAVDDAKAAVKVLLFRRCRRRRREGEKEICENISVLELNCVC